MLTSQLHCGACNQNFDDNEKLTEHLKSCKAAKAILFPYTVLAIGGNSVDTGHFVAHLMWQIPKCSGYISDYAKAISEDMGSLQRSIIHKRLCEKLGIDYQQFRPFESESITEIPTKQEAEKIIYEALGRLAREKIFT